MIMWFHFRELTFYDELGREVCTKVQVPYWHSVAGDIDAQFAGDIDTQFADDNDTQFAGDMYIIFCLFVFEVKCMTALSDHHHQSWADADDLS